MTTYSKGASYFSTSSGAAQFPKADHSGGTYVESVFAATDDVRLLTLEISSDPNAVAVVTNPITITVVDKDGAPLFDWVSGKNAALPRFKTYGPHGLQMPAGGFGVNTGQTGVTVMTSFVISKADPIGT